MSYFGEDNRIPPDDERRKRVIALWLAVGGSMAVILASWVLLLPWQLGSVVGAARLDSSRWAVVRPAQADSDFMETLKQVGDNFERLSARGSEGADAAADSGIPPEVNEFIGALNGLRGGQPAPQSAAAEPEAAVVNQQNDADQED